MIDKNALAAELFEAYNSHQKIAAPPSARGAAFTMDDAYAVEAEFARLRAAAGHKTTGRKVGYANKAIWRILKLDTLTFAHMYDDTVHYGTVAFSLAGLHQPRIEPEIVFKLKIAVGDDPLAAIEWVALGFEIIDCPFPDWKVQPVDFVSAGGLHAALLIGEQIPIEAVTADELAKFKLALSKNGELAHEGSGKNSLRSPALCLAELAKAAANRVKPLQPGELISTGTLTGEQSVVAGETWTAQVEGIALPPLSVRFI